MAVGSRDGAQRTNGSWDRSSAARNNEPFGPEVMRSRPVNSLQALQALQASVSGVSKVEYFFEERKKVWRGVGLQDKTPSFASCAGAAGVSLPSNYGSV